MGGDKIHEITTLAELHELFSSTTYVVIDFCTDRCPPCRRIAPTYSRLAAEHAAPGRLAFAKVKVDKGAEVADEYSIRSIPTFVFFKDGRHVPVPANGDSVFIGVNEVALQAAIEKLAVLAQTDADGATTNRAGAAEAE